jgi:hypothetical protein
MFNVIVFIIIGVIVFIFLKELIEDLNPPKENLCPYYKKLFKRCNLDGSKIDENSAYASNCYFTSYHSYFGKRSDWRNCSTYKNSSLEEKESKQLSPNYDLKYKNYQS